MRHHGRFLAVVLALAFSMLSLTPRPAPAQTALPPRPADSWIVDTAGLLSLEEVGELRAISERIARERGVRLVLLAIPSLGGEEPKPIAVRALNDWQAGRRGVLLLVSKEPRKLYLQPGIELANQFDEPAASALCRDVIAPRLRSGPAGPALRAGFEAVEARLIAAPPAPRSGRPVATLWIVLGALGLSIAGLFGGFFWFSRTKCIWCGSRRTSRLGSTIHCRACGESFRAKGVTASEGGSSRLGFWDGYLWGLLNSSNDATRRPDSTSGSPGPSGIDSSPTVSSDGSGGGGSDW
jgi:uncharacterized membrane protein YgcG